MKNILNNKFLLTLLLFLIITFISISNVFANCDYNFEYNNENYALILPDWVQNYKVNFFIEEKNNGIYYRLIISNAGVYYDSSSNKIISNDNSGFLAYINGSYDYNNYNPFSNWLSTNFANITQEEDGVNETSGLGSSGISKYVCCVGNSNVLNENGEMVFLLAPLTPEITKALVEQAKTVNPLEQIRVIIPVVIITIIMIIALYKSFKMLQKLLRTA